MMRYKFLFTLFLLIFALQKGNAQMYVKELPHGKLPVPTTGKIIDAYEFKDASGLHIYAVTKSEENKKGYKITIVASCYTQTNGAFVKDWSITDFTTAPILLFQKNTQIVDIDKDGVYETLFVYQLNPNGGGGSDWKIMLHYKNKKYALRARIAGFGMTDAPVITFDPAFDTIPASFKSYVKDYWNDVSQRNELDAELKQVSIIFTLMFHPEENPWQITSEKQVYDNPWINVTEYKVINPSGNPGIYGKVHYKNLAIGVLPLDDEMNTYLVGQYRFPLNQYSWEMPEGGGVLGIDPIESAKRELLEETGLKADSWTEIQRLHLSNSVSDELSILYLARGLHQLEAEPEDTEQLIIKKLPFAEVYQMVCNGTITDAMTVVAVLKIQLMILEGKL